MVWAWHPPLVQSQLSGIRTMNMRSGEALRPVVHRMTAGRSIGLKDLMTSGVSLISRVKSKVVSDLSQTLI